MGSKNIYAFMNSFTSGIDGGSRYFLQLARYLSNSNKVTIITSELGKELALNYSRDFSFIIIDKRKHFNNIILTYLYRMFRALSIKINLDNTDVLYASSDILPDVLPIFFKKIFNKNVRYIQRFHAIASPNNKISFLSQKISILFIRLKADVVLATNKDIKKFLIDKGVPEKKIEIIPVGIDFSEIRKIKISKEFSFDAVFVNRLTIEKGIFDLLKIWHIICVKLPQAKLAIVGSGNADMINKINKYIFDNNLKNNIELFGFIGDVNLKYNIISSSKIFLLTSHSESFSLSAAEAMALKLPVISYDLPQLKNIYKNSIVYIKLLDLYKFAEKIAEMMLDEKIRENYGTLGYAEIIKYDIEESFKKEYSFITYHEK